MIHILLVELQPVRLYRHPYPMGRNNGRMLYWAPEFVAVGDGMRYLPVVHRFRVFRAMSADSIAHKPEIPERKQLSTVITVKSEEI